jgi:hypothetical protein
MAKSTPMVSDRVDDIAHRIRAACSAVAEPTQRMEDAQEAMQEASRDGSNTRLSVVTDVAAMAHAEDWTNGEVAQACERAAKMGNASGGDASRSAKSVGVFISEMKTFASPKVRGYLPNLREICDEAWADETELLASVEREDRDAIKTPVRKWQSRFYHLLMNVARAVKDGTLNGSMSKQDLVDYAVANDPDHNATKVAARLKTIIASIDAFHADFGMEELQTAAEYLRTITTEELLAARKTLLASQAALTPPPVVEAPAPVIAAPAPAEASAQAEADVAEGVLDYDEFDSLIGDAAARAAASANLIERQVMTSLLVA